jgi:hypothetical protein
MSETYYAGVYWGCRPEPAQECARQAESFFHLLSRCDPIYARWFEQASSLKRALQLQFEPTSDTFVRFFRRKTYQVGKDGFLFGTWTGHEEGHGASVMLRCGSAAEAAPNRATLSTPSEEPERERVLSVPVLTEVMRAMVLAWEPAWGMVTSHDFEDRLSGEAPPGTSVGWLTYISRPWGQVPVLPEPVRVEPVEDKGTLVILTPERLSVSNPEHLVLGHHVKQLLVERGLLRKVLEHRP